MSWMLLKTLRAFLIFNSSKNSSLGHFMKFLWSFCGPKITPYFAKQNTSLKVTTGFLKSRWHCHQMSLLLTENRQMYGGFCLDFAAIQFDDEMEKRVTKCPSDSVEIAQDVSQWYRGCQSCRGKSPLQLPRSAEHDLCGRLQFIQTKSTARKLLLESDWSGLKRATCALVKINYLEEFSNSSPTLQGGLKSRWRVQNTSPLKFSWSFPWSIWK